MSYLRYLWCLVALMAAAEAKSSVAGAEIAPDPLIREDALWIVDGKDRLEREHSYVVNASTTALEHVPDGKPFKFQGDSHFAGVAGAVTGWVQHAMLQRGLCRLPVLGAKGSKEPYSTIFATPDLSSSPAVLLLIQGLGAVRCVLPAACLTALPQAPCHCPTDQACGLAPWL